MDDFKNFRRTIRSNPLFTDPIELYGALNVVDSRIENLWLSQGDALRSWHEHRASRDVVVAMNTGGGKTLVGLLCAQSLVNELKAPVAYVCGTRQLVTQTVEHSRNYGLQVTSYLSGEYSNDLYLSKKAPLVTTYHAVFNGLSRFKGTEFAAIIFDDAHLAEQILRDVYTLTITRAEHKASLLKIQNFFREYFRKSDRLTKYDESCKEGSYKDIAFVPPFAVLAHKRELEEILLEASLSRCESCKYPWEYLSEQPSQCAIFVTGDQVTMTPPIFPSLANDTLQSPLRRVYLSASLDVSDSFLRTFGRLPDQVIRPATDAGDCERLILFPNLFSLNEKVDERQSAKKLISDQKAIIAVPSYARAVAWKDTVTPPPDVIDAVEQFKKSAPPAKLLMVARFDGVDFPGDTCRVMVLDGVPRGVSILERYLVERLGIKKVIVSQVASRVFQWFGRICRGKRDVGVFFVLSTDLREWLSEHGALLPSFLQNQISLGRDISGKVTKVESAGGLIAECLADPRQPSLRENWTSMYDMALKEPQYEEPWIDYSALQKFAQVEVAVGSAYWLRDWDKVSRLLTSEVFDQLRLTSRRAASWLLYWTAYAHQIANDQSTANQIYKRVWGNAKNILYPPINLASDQVYDSCAAQADRIFGKLSPTTLAKLDVCVLTLDLQMISSSDDNTSNRVEEALRVVGELLGVDSTRPDKDSSGSGPDVSWRLPGEPALLIELKSEKYKTTESVYTKDDLSQLDDHRRWATRNGIEEAEVIFVGPNRLSSRESNPALDTNVISLDQFHELAKKLRLIIEHIDAISAPLTQRADVADALRVAGLNYGKVIDGFSRFSVLRAGKI